MKQYFSFSIRKTADAGVSTSAYFIKAIKLLRKFTLKVSKEHIESFYNLKFVIR